MYVKGYENIILREGRKEYMAPSEIAKEFGLSYTTVWRRVKELRKQIGYGKRYKRYAIINEEGTSLINKLVFADFLSVREILNDEEASKELLPFDGAEISMYLGFFKDTTISPEVLEGIRRIKEDEEKRKRKEAGLDA